MLDNFEEYNSFEISEGQRYVILRYESEEKAEEVLDKYRQDQSLRQKYLDFPFVGSKRTPSINLEDRNEIIAARSQIENLCEISEELLEE